MSKKAVVVKQQSGYGGDRIKGKTKYTLIFVLCAMFSVLPFSAAADTSTASTNGNHNSIQTAAGTNEVSGYGLKIGDNGSKVVELQKWLKTQGYYVGAIDGDFGPYTKQAVEYFQNDSNIVVDGWVADQTVGAMNDLTGTTFSLSQGTTNATTSKATTNATTSKVTTNATTSKATTNATTSKATTNATTSKATTSKATTSKATTSKATTTATSTTSKVTSTATTTTSKVTSTATSSSSLSEILASGAKYSYSHSASTAAAMESIGSGDCWAMSDYLFSKLSAAGISSRIVQYSTAYSSNHRSVQLYQNGAWVDVPYSSYGYDTMFHATASKPGMTVLASS